MNTHEKNARGRVETMKANMLALADQMKPGTAYAAAGGISAAQVAEIKEFLASIDEGFGDFKAEHKAEIEKVKEALDANNEELRELSIKFAASKTIGQWDAPDFHVDDAKKQFAAFARGRIRAAMSTDSNPDGGYTVPKVIDNEINRLAYNISPMRGLATVVTAGERWTKLVDMQGEAVEWHGERTAVNATQGMKLAELTFPTFQMTAFPLVTQYLLDDTAFDIATLLATNLALRFAKAEGDAFINGDGVYKPRGIAAYTMVDDASYSWGNVGWVKTGSASSFAADPAGPDCLTKLYYALNSEYRGPATWLMNSKTAGIIRLMKDSQGRPLWVDSLAAGQPPLLLGKPVAFAESMDDIGAGKYPVALGDWQRAYLIHDLPQGTRVLRDEYSQKPFVGFYTTRRVGGGIQDFGALKFIKVSA